MNVRDKLDAHGYLYLLFPAIQVIALLLMVDQSARADHAAISDVCVTDGNDLTGRRARQPEVWLCAGDRIADLLDPDADWPFVQKHLAGIKFYIGHSMARGAKLAKSPCNGFVNTPGW